VKVVVRFVDENDWPLSGRKGGSGKWRLENGVRHLLGIRRADPQHGGGALQ